MPLFIIVFLNALLTGAFLLLLWRKLNSAENTVNDLRRRIAEAEREIDALRKHGAVKGEGEEPKPDGFDNIFNYGYGVALSAERRRREGVERNE